MNKNELLNQAFALITLYIAEFPPCICSEGYTGRNLVDPSCQHCDDIDTYNNMVAWQKSWYEEMGRLTPRALDGVLVSVNERNEITCKVCGRGMGANPPRQ